MDSLSLKYRPKSFSDVVGQRLTSLVLQRMLDTNSVPHALLFSGPSGSGKTSAARILASGLNPASSADVASSISVDVLEVDAASNGGVADIRSIVESLRYQATGSARVIIMDEAHSVTREGFNALLKPTEEDSGAIFIFVTTEPEKIPRTILSRLTEFSFHRVSTNEVFDRLKVVVGLENISLPDELIFDIAQRSEGNVRSALISLDKVVRAGIISTEEYSELLGDHDLAPALLAALLTGNAATYFGVLDDQLVSVGNPAHISTQLVRCLRDILVLRSGGTLHYTGTSLESRKELAHLIEADRVLAGVKLLWDLKTRIRGSEDARGNLEMSLMLIAEVFSRGKSQPAPPVPQTVRSAAPAIPEVQEPQRKLTLSEIQLRTSRGRQ